ncbi:ROK family protein [Lactobacillus sp. Sy-1]|uniref:ROK family protein n=1 Tax=Lactobacillus sp. Sy-1 TaxID=2109645 RepID=UPI001C5AD03E|nr:ROK family protein [Lactobacillus sp. Sy-1]MBW1606276.1 ROK family protein [Lactobacillus sp. Sy-1]
MLLGSIEAGGTKFICSVGDENLTVLDQVRIETTTPEITLGKVIEYFSQFADLDSLSIASFGPLNLDSASPAFGSILNTPKLLWKNVNIMTIIRDALNVPVFITTDVNGSAVGENLFLKQAGINLHSLVYLTVGTGIGAGIIVNDQILGSNGHPEVGHIRVIKHPDDADFHGTCPFHDGCLEGMAAGPSLKARTNIPGECLALDDPIWDRLAYYLAQAVGSLNLIIHPARIVFGGSVVNPQLLSKIKKDYVQLMNGYVATDHLDDFLIRSCVPNNGSATIGNFALARKLVRV